LRPGFVAVGQGHQRRSYGRTTPCDRAKTPEITIEQARRLLSGIDARHVVGLRDRAIIAMLIYTAARIGAVAGLRSRDFFDVGDQYCLRFLDKGASLAKFPSATTCRASYSTTSALPALPARRPSRRCSVQPSAGPRHLPVPA
jgi:integrase